MISDIEQRIKDYWKGTPAIVIVKEIKRRTELPKWEDCPKDHIYVGVSRLKRGDKITVVRHKIEMSCTAKKTRTEDLSEKDMYFTGAVPPYKDMTCKQCGEFSTRINIGNICQDCTDKNKVTAS
ncbi:hypothetical protein [Desulfosporosinus nitroreducens]|uniref:hypothetical protein n=1 Tax=Desulfosporosinus nitroreducens TaxID=2018668 RepID=UPI00207C824D|nr:hypothetical protein [Desulfosporosinus nitroreducens]MCO1599861.1 hypothetical protein [Desulfosporosinus nitroreducens]